MNLKIRKLRKQDYKQAIKFAIKGMHFGWYLDNKFLLNLYGTYFWYNELNHATQVIAAYCGDKLSGVLLAQINGENRNYKSLGKTVFTRLFNFLQNLFYSGGVDVYDEANRSMLAAYKRKNKPDGQLIFLAANPDTKIQGIGTLLLKELERREKGKLVYLYTDNGCTYQFYEHRGFERNEEKDIIMLINKKKVPLKCMLYSRRL